MSKAVGSASAQALHQRAVTSFGNPKLELKVAGARTLKELIVTRSIGSSNGPAAGEAAVD